MKLTLIFIAAMFAANLLFAQTTPGCFPYPKTISVTGSAEMNIVPDEIYVRVDLREYKKKGEDKKEIDIIKSEFLANCKAAGIPDSNISVASYDGYNMSNVWRRRRKDPDLLSAISYQIKFQNAGLIDNLVNRLDDEATSNFAIIRTSHSRITEYRKQLKIQAIKAAKEKAQYLAEAVNEQIGSAITITEPEETQLSDESANAKNYNFSFSNSMKEIKYKGADADDPAPDYRKIKLRFEVSVLYALK